MFTPNEIAAGSIPYHCLPNLETADIFLLGKLAGVTDVDAINAGSVGFHLPTTPYELAVTFLLAQAAGSNPAEIAAGILRYGNLRDRRAATLYLLDLIISNGIGGTCNYQDMQMAWTPAAYPLGEKILWFFPDDLTGLTSITFLGSTTGGIFVGPQGTSSGPSDIESASFPNLVTIDPLSISQGYFNFLTCAKLTLISAPLLESMPGNVYIQDCDLMPSVSLPVLQSCGGCGIRGLSLVSVSLPSLVTVGTGYGLAIINSPLLTTIDLTSFAPLDGSPLLFINNALSQASVDAILARCVASAGFLSGTLDLSGGTNSAPSSTAPGSDYDILINRGVTVLVNP